jgi:hypothetical protein
MVGLGCIEVLILVGLGVLVLFGLSAARRRRAAEEKPPEDDPGW